MGNGTQRTEGPIKRTAEVKFAHGQDPLKEGEMDRDHNTCAGSLKF